MEHLTSRDIEDLSTLAFVQKAKKLLAEKKDILDPMRAKEIKDILIKMLTATNEKMIKTVKGVVREEINKMLGKRN